MLVRQYRYAVDARVWELPAGRRDPGETPEEGARRELEEEVGLRPRFARAAARVLDDARLLRRGHAPVPRHRPSRSPRRGPSRTSGSRSRDFTLEEALAMVRRGEIREGKTLVALLLERPAARLAPSETGPLGRLRALGGSRPQSPR